MTPAPPAAAARTASRGGAVATIVLCVALLAYTALLSVEGLFIGFVSDSCGEHTCNFGLLQAVVLIGAFGPAAVTVATIAVSIVRLVRRRRLTWLFPIGGGLIATIILYVAVVLGYASAGLDFFGQS